MTTREEQNCVVSYDTLILNAKLSNDEIENVFNLIEKSNFYLDQSYRYVFHHKEAGFHIKKATE